MRAAAKLGLSIVLMSSAFLTNPEGEHGKVACIGDHINIAGASPLIGANKSGVRFPGLEGAYRQVPGIPAIKAFWQFDFRQALTANKTAAKVLGADVVTGLGPAQAILARPAGAKNVAHLVVQEKDFEYWTIPEDVVAAALFA